MSENISHSRKKLKVELHDIYLAICAVVIFMSIAIFYIWPTMIDGIPVEPSGKWWHTASILILSLVTSKLVPKERSHTVQHVCGLVILATLVLASVLEYMQVMPPQLSTTAP